MTKCGAHGENDIPLCLTRPRFGRSRLRQASYCHWYELANPWHRQITRCCISTLSVKITQLRYESSALNKPSAITYWQKLGLSYTGRSLISASCKNCMKCRRSSGCHSSRKLWATERREVNKLGRAIEESRDVRRQ
jgi:hypothetical protein